MRTIEFRTLPAVVAGIALAALVGLYTTSASTANIEIRERAIVISGEIVAGDADRFEDAVQRLINVRIVQLRASPGGNLKEAMRIGDLIRRLKLITDVASLTDSGPAIDISSPKDPDGSRARIFGTDADATCASACFFIWIAGVVRQGDYMLVVHRPYFDPAEFGKLDSDQAQSEYIELEKVAYSYLESMGTPRSVIDLMRRTSSNNGVRLEPDFVIRELQPLAPDIDEWFRAKCGSFSPTLVNKAQEWSKRSSFSAVMIFDKAGRGFFSGTIGGYIPPDLWQEIPLVAYYGSLTGSADAFEASNDKLKCVMKAVGTEQSLAWTRWMTELVTNMPCKVQTAEEIGKADHHRRGGITVFSLPSFPDPRTVDASPAARLFDDLPYDVTPTWRTIGDTKADVFRDNTGTFLRLRSGTSGPAIVFDIAQDVLNQIAGKSALFDIVARAEGGKSTLTEGKATVISVVCNFGELGDCGLQQRFAVDCNKDDSIFNIKLPAKAPGAEGTISIHADVHNDGKSIDIYEVKVFILKKRQRRSD